MTTDTTTKARELRLMANRMRRAGEGWLAHQLDKRAAEVLLDIGSAGQPDGRMVSRQDAALAWLRIYESAMSQAERLWSPAAMEPASGWIGARGEGGQVAVLMPWVAERLKAMGSPPVVVQEWKRNGWIQPDATGKTAMLTRGPNGRQRMIRMRLDALPVVQALDIDGEGLASGADVG